MTILINDLSRRPVARILSLLIGIVALCATPNKVAAHPLGNFTINGFARIRFESNQLRMRYVVDMAEIPTFQETQSMDSNRDGKVSAEESAAYLDTLAPRLVEGLVLTQDGSRIPLRLASKSISMPLGNGGLATLRIECDLEAAVSNYASNGNRFRFEDTNYGERAGWHEIVVETAPGISAFDSSAFGTGVTDELKTYPEDKLAVPLAERSAELSLTQGVMPAGAVALRTRDGRTAVQARDRFAELISVKELTPFAALFGLLLAMGLGAMHAMSPGHGKTVVGAYLVGSKGTAKHAAFLGLTVTLTHTSSVFALGLLTLFASHYILPEKLFPYLSFVSGAIVLVIGLTAFMRRLGLIFTNTATDHDHHEEHDHGDGHTHSHGGGQAHSHLPPGADGQPVTWRNLLALGISGGLLPCPSALVVMLSAVSLGRVGYGLALILAFSVGLAATLTAVGLLFVYAGRYVQSRRTGEGRIVKILPVLSALVISCVGAAICYEALAQAGVNLPALVTSIFAGSSHEEAAPSLASFGAFAVLGLGMLFGLKHATEVDHVIAVSTIVSEHRNLLRATLVGGLWGAGHTASLIVVGVFVLTLRVAIPERLASWLEFGVALMIIGLGVNALLRALRGKNDAHVHQHAHDGVEHAHIHFHDEAGEPHAANHSHAIKRIGLKPVLVGAMHGLAGSAALTLLVLAQIQSVALGLVYLTVFGLGSIVGMMVMSGLVGLPFVLGSGRAVGLNHRLQLVVATLSIAFGCWYAYSTGISNGLI